MSLEYFVQFKEKCNGNLILIKAIKELTQKALNTRKEIAKCLMETTQKSNEQKLEIVTLLEAEFNGNVKIPFCILCIENGVELQSDAFTFDDICNSAI